MLTAVHLATCIMQEEQSIQVQTPANVLNAFLSLFYIELFLLKHILNYVIYSYYCST